MHCLETVLWQRLANKLLIIWGPKLLRKCSSSQQKQKKKAKFDMAEHVNMGLIPVFSGLSCGYGKIIQAVSNCAIFCHFPFTFQQHFQILDRWWAIRSMRKFLMSKRSLVFVPCYFPNGNFIFLYLHGIL